MISVLNFILKVVISPDIKFQHEELVQRFWEQLRSFDGEVVYVGNANIQHNTYLLGVKDNRWYLGTCKGEDVESIRPHLKKLIAKISTHEAEKSLPKSDICVSSHQVRTVFSIHTNMDDVYRIVAKISINCLAVLKGQNFVLSESFSTIKYAILTGENISQYVWISKWDNTVLELLRSISKDISIGEKCHSVTFVQKEGVLYGVVSLFGSVNLYIVKIGEVDPYVITDFYICDWENKKEYSMIDCVMKICDCANK